VSGSLALVLHAHLPWVRHPEHDRPLEERWLHEAIWESYLPLLGVLDRLAEDGVVAPLTLSISPPLAAMLADGLLRARFSGHLDRLEALAARLDARALVAPELGPALAFHRARLAEARAGWDHHGGDLLSAFRAHAEAGRLELWTTAATHAYLPGLCTSPASIRAQLRLGLRAFEHLVGVRPRGLWLPECAYDPRLSQDLARSGARYTVLDAHGLELARPRPAAGIFAPVLSPPGVAFFARDPEAARDVWSRQTGYPGDPAYRDFYRDVGFDLPEDALDGEIGPFGVRIQTGLKLHRITGPWTDKAPYDPPAALARAREHAAHFLEARARVAREAEARTSAPILVAPFDAELFGHWWFEGPVFLEHVLRGLAAREGGLAPTTPGAWLAAHPELTVAEPAPSTWGEGGFGEVWAGPAAAALLRHVHHAERGVRAAVAQRRGAQGLAGRAVDQAIRELVLLQSSDWPFMIHRGETAAYAESRVRAHVHRAARCAALALAAEPSAEDAAWLHAVADRDRFLADLSGERLRDAFDPW
jgi:1,4-alpha-glucan branching enzyme